MTWRSATLWFPPRKIPLEDGTARLLPVLVITAAHSRFMLGRMIPTRKTEDLLLGSWELLQQLGRVPRRLIWDNEPGIGRGQRRADGVAAFMGTLATRLVLLPPKDPESKGIVERRNGWFETSFMPGRSFTSPADFNAQFSRLAGEGERPGGAHDQGRAGRPIDADRAAMLPLPPIPLHLGWRNRIRLGRDYYVRLDTTDYSVDPHADRPDRRCQRRPATGSRSASTGGSWPTTRGSWARGDDDHRPRPRRTPPPACARQFQAPRAVAASTT